MFVNPLICTEQQLARHLLVSLIDGLWQLITTLHLKMVLLLFLSAQNYVSLKNLNITYKMFLNNNKNVGSYFLKNIILIFLFLFLFFFISFKIYLFKIKLKAMV